MDHTNIYTYIYIYIILNLRIPKGKTLLEVVLVYIFLHKAAHPQNNNQKTTQYSRYLLKFQISGFTLATCNMHVSTKKKKKNMQHYLNVQNKTRKIYSYLRRLQRGIVNMHLQPLIFLISRQEKLLVTVIYFVKGVFTYVSCFYVYVLQQKAYKLYNYDSYTDFGYLPGKTNIYFLINIHTKSE